MARVQKFKTILRLNDFVPEVTDCLTLVSALFILKASEGYLVSLILLASVSHFCCTHVLDHSKLE